MTGFSNRVAQEWKNQIAETENLTLCSMPIAAPMDFLSLAETGPEYVICWEYLASWRLKIKPNQEAVRNARLSRQP
jgi:hypothetical protein